MLRLSAYALVALTALVSARADAQMPAAVVGGTNLIEASRSTATVSVTSSAERTTAPDMRTLGGAATTQQPGLPAGLAAALAAATAAPGLTPGVVTGVVQVAPTPAGPAARPLEPGAPIRIRKPASPGDETRRAAAPGEAVRAAAPARAPERPRGAGVPIYVVG